MNIRNSIILFWAICMSICMIVQSLFSHAAIKELKDLSQPKAAFELKGTFIGDGLSVVHMHFDDYRFMDRLGMFQHCDVTNILERLHGPEKHTLKQWSPVLIPQYGQNRVWATWDGERNKWEVSPVTNSPTSVYVMVKTVSRS